MVVFLCVFITSSRNKQIMREASRVLKEGAGETALFLLGARYLTKGMQPINCWIHIGNWKWDDTS